MQSILRLADIMLINAEGNIVFSTEPKHFLEEFSHALYDPNQKAFQQERKYIYFSDVFYNKGQNRISMLVTAPATDFNDNFIGVIVFEIDMKVVYTIIQDVTGLGETGEVLLGKNIGGKVVYLNPLRHDPNAALTRAVSLGERFGGPIQEAVQGRTGASSQLIDYRGVEVIAAWRHISLLNWGMVAKIDTREAFAAAIKLRNWTVLILTGFLIVSCIMAISIAHSIGEPIKRLTNGAEKVGSGDLDYRVGTTSNDEIGQLSRTFDKMTANLKVTTASRDELNKEIDERKHAQEALINVNKELEQFAYIASHDLQEPLRVITGYLQLIERRYKDKLDKDADEFINFAVDGARRMQSLITDLLVFSRLTRKPKPFTLIDCNTVIKNVVLNLESVIQSTNAVIMSEPLPSVSGDETQLTQLFQNLISNGIKFHSDKKPQININAQKTDSEWLFSVKDNGIGIEDIYKERIFVIFQRLHSRDEYPGTGIGLAICKKVVEKHGGRIWVESEPGKGSTFYFTIPDKGD